MTDAPIIPPATCPAIIVAAGSSQRMGFDKLAAKLCGIPVLQRTLAQLNASSSVSELVVVCPKSRWEMIDLQAVVKPLQRVDGGAERQDSVAAGLAVLDRKHRWVAVHDGARPLVSAVDISRCLAAAQTHRAAALARRVTETLKRTTADDFSKEAVSREGLWFMETPQIVDAQLLRDAFEHVQAAGICVTDEISAIAELGVSAKLIESTHPNPKITTPADLLLAAALLTS